MRSRPDDFVTNFPLMVLRGPLMGSHVGEGEHTITFKTLYPLPAKTCRYTLKGKNSPWIRCSNQTSRIEENPDTLVNTTVSFQCTRCVAHRYPF